MPSNIWKPLLQTLLGVGLTATVVLVPSAWKVPAFLLYAILYFLANWLVLLAPDERLTDARRANLDWMLGELLNELDRGRPDDANRFELTSTNDPEHYSWNACIPSTEQAKPP